MADSTEVAHDLAARALVLAPGDTATLTGLYEELGRWISAAKLDGELATIAASAAAHLAKAIGADEHDRGGDIDEAARLLASMTAREPCAADAPAAMNTGAKAAVATAGRPIVDDGFEIFETGVPPAPEETPRATIVLASAQERELMGEFVVEARQNLADAEAALLELEAHPDDKPAIDRVFRAFHTVKGVSAMLGFDAIAAFAHAAESLLSQIRTGELRCTGRNATLTLRAIDALRGCIDGVERSLDGTSPLELPGTLAALIAALGAPDTGRGANTDLAALSAVPIDASVASEIAGQRAPGKADGDSAWMRVRTDRLDRLIDMVGELVIAQSMVSQDPVLVMPKHEEFRKKVAHGAKIVRELQDLSMSLRMVPLKSTFQKLNRVVRDVVQRTDKDVRFFTDGDETEIDRNMVDVVADPLVHMVRNAVDHGVESNEERVAAGKPAQGTVRLSAFHSGGHLVLRLSDDGKGMDRKAIAAKAIERGIIRSDAAMTDDEVLNLIFEPGFSTRDTVTDISGRGVGMDVVKRGVEALKGRIETTTVLGKGTTFTIHVPLTLSITDGMLVRVGKERFILPTVAIRTSFRPTKDMLSKVAGRGEFVRVRDEFVSVFRLHHIFDIDGAEHDPTKALIVVVDYGEGRSAFMVDELLTQQQVVSKGLASSLLNVPGVAGGAILGDGRVGLILDPPGLVALAHQTNGWVNAA